MITERWPRGLRRAAVYGAVVLALVSYIVWERSNMPDAPVTKFQGGIAEPERYSSPSPIPTTEPSPAPSSSPARSTGTMIITVTDDSGSGVRGIMVHVEGPIRSVLKTDEEGKLKLVGPAGYYGFRIDAGCTDTLQILSSATGRGGIAEGKTGNGQLSIVWRHRFRPWHPSFPSLTPYWPIGETVDVGFYVADRCKGEDRAPGARYDTFGFRPSPNLEIVGNPTAIADDKGHGYVTVRCTSPGAVSLVAFDRRNKTDEEMDLLSEDVSSGTRPECR